MTSHVHQPPFEDDLSELYETAPCGFVSSLPDGLIVRVNRTFSEWTGFAAEQLIGERRFESLLTTPGRIYFQTHFAPLLRMQGFVSEVAVDFLCADGGRLPAFVNAVIKFSDLGEPAMVRSTIFRATDRRRYEQELLHAKRAAEEAQTALKTLAASLEQRVEEEVASRLRVEEALRQAQKMEALGQLTGGVAHDFNNMLAVIAGGLQKIGRIIGKAPADENADQIEQARAMAMSGVERAKALTQRLLAFARRQELEPTRLNVSHLVEGMRDLLRQALGGAVTLEMELASDVRAVFADASELENALLNLAVNARDAMPDGGALRIVTANCGGAAVPIRMPEHVKECVLIAVRDTGVGMSKETLERVFEPFFTTKEQGRGTGLGLSQVHGFVRQSGGQVHIESALGAGTSVEIYLPASP